MGASRGPIHLPIGCCQSPCPASWVDEITLQCAYSTTVGASHCDVTGARETGSPLIKHQSGATTDDGIGNAGRTIGPSDEWLKCCKRRVDWLTTCRLAAMCEICLVGSLLMLVSAPRGKLTL